MNFPDYSNILLPIIIGLTQIFKNFNIPSKYMPVISIIIAEILCFTILEDRGISEKLMQGLQLGLASAGLYSATKNLTDNNKDK